MYFSITHIYIAIAWMHDDECGNEVMSLKNKYHPTESAIFFLIASTLLDSSNFYSTEIKIFLKKLIEFIPVKILALNKTFSH